MHIKWIGSLLIVAGCGGLGICLSSLLHRERSMLQSLVSLLTYLECRLRCQLTPLPELCRQAGHSCGGTLGDVFLNFSRELDWQSAPDPDSCMAEAIRKSHSLPSSVRHLLRRMGASFGRFDLTGQLQELSLIRDLCREQLQQSSSVLSGRVRTCNALAFSAGAAAAIVLL